MVFALKSTARPFARLGILRASREVAERALGEWKRDLLVFPGGDLDTWRPWSERYQVRFSGRVGYARTALKTGTPIVPVAHAGAHDTLIVLSDGHRLAARLRFPELFRAQIFPVHLSFPFLLGVGPTPHLPPPVTLRYRVAAPIWPDEVVPEGQEPSREAILALDARVRAAMQHELDILRDTTPRVGDRLRGAMRRLKPIRQMWQRAVV
jgi:1-acyl-sn-glycerol-3-phosphate acyltransferase